MGRPSAGISGVAVGVVMAGGIVLVSGYKNASISDTLRALIKNQPIPSKQQDTSLGKYLGDAGSGGGGASGDFGPAAPGAAEGKATPTGALGASIAADAQKYLGVPYRFGGADPKGMDCSGLVTYVLHHDLGVNLPSNTHTVTGQFYVWSGAVTVPASEATPGDLVCWTGHIGIYVGGGKMIHAPHAGAVVQASSVWNVPPPIYRRVKG